MEKDIAKISTVLSEELRVKMIELANAIPKEVFKLSEIINPTNFEAKENSNGKLVICHERRLREHFLELVRAGIIVKIPNKYLYQYNRRVMQQHSKDISELSNN